QPAAHRSASRHPGGRTIGRRYWSRSVSLSIPAFSRTGVQRDRIEANSLLAFFGVSIAIQNLSSMAFTGNARAYQHLDNVIQIGSASILGNRLAALVIALTLCIAVVLFFRFTRLGLAVRAVIQSRDAAEIVGVGVHKTYLLTFCIGFGLA